MYTEYIQPSETYPINFSDPIVKAVQSYQSFKYSESEPINKLMEVITLYLDPQNPGKPFICRVSQVQKRYYGYHPDKVPKNKIISRSWVTTLNKQGESEGLFVRVKGKPYQNGKGGFSQDWYYQLTEKGVRAWEKKISLIKSPCTLKHALCFPEVKSAPKSPIKVSPSIVSEKKKDKPSTKKVYSYFPVTRDTNTGLKNYISSGTTASQESYELSKELLEMVGISHFDRFNDKVKLTKLMGMAIDKKGFDWVAKVLLNASKSYPNKNIMQCKLSKFFKEVK